MCQLLVCFMLLIALPHATRAAIDGAMTSTHERIGKVEVMVPGPDSSQPATMGG